MIETARPILRPPRAADWPALRAFRLSSRMTAPSRAASARDRASCGAMQPAAAKPHGTATRARRHGRGVIA